MSRNIELFSNENMKSYQIQNLMFDSSVMSTIPNIHSLTFRWARAHACGVYHAQYNVSLVRSIRPTKGICLENFIE